MPGADVEDGVASVRAMVAIARSAETGEPVRARRRVRGGLMRLGIFAKTFPGTDPAGRAGRGRATPATPARSSTWPAAACPRCRTRSPADGRTRSRRRRASRGRGDRGALGHLQHDPSRPGGARRWACAGWSVLAGAAAGMGDAARDALHRHARSRGPVAPPSRTTARPTAWRDLLAEMEKAAGARRARTASTSASSPSSPTS